MVKVFIEWLKVSPWEDKFGRLYWPVTVDDDWVEATYPMNTCRICNLTHRQPNKHQET